MKFSLKCTNGHGFEGWFPNKEELLKQLNINLVDCPHCGSNQVDKTLSTPNVSTKNNKKNHTSIIEDQSSKIEKNYPSETSNHKDNISLKNDSLNTLQVRSLLKDLQKTVEKEFTNVGDNFANEARKIHYGQKKPENIYGKCTDNEKSKLKEEGIEFSSLPWLPRDN